jgi:hypothetical protein
MGGPVLDSRALPPPTSSNDLMEPEVYRAASNPFRDEMGSSSSPSSISTAGPFDPISNAQPWQSCAPVTRWATPNHKPDPSVRCSAESVNALSWRRLGMKTVPSLESHKSGAVGPCTSPLILVALVFLHGLRLTRLCQVLSESLRRVRLFQ